MLHPTGLLKMPLSIKVTVMQVDSYEFAEPKDIIPELKKDFWDGLASAKWSERKVCCLPW